MSIEGTAKFIMTFALGALVFVATISIAASGSDLYADLTKIQGLLRTADDRLVQLSTKSCQAGGGFVEFCPFIGNVTWSETVACILFSLLNGPVSKEVEVYFDSPFVTTPVIGYGTSGLTWAFATTYNITITKLTPASATFLVTAVYSPSAVRFAFMACDQDVLFPKAYLDIQEEIAFYN